MPGTILGSGGEGRLGAGIQACTRVPALLS